MDSLIDIAAARALVADAALWPRVRDFLWDFAPQVHESWLDSSVVRWLGGSADIQPSNHRTTEPPNHPTTEPPNHPTTESPNHPTTQPPNHRTNKYILSTLGIEPCFHAFPKDDWSRLVLLDGQTLELIVKWLGALACAEDLRRVTDGKAVRELKAALPGIYPEVFGYTAYFARTDSLRGDEETQSEEVPDAGGRPSIVENVVSAGLSIVDSLLADVPSPLAARFRFKLPKSLCASASPRLKKETCGTVVAKLLKLKFPEAYRLCC